MFCSAARLINCFDNSEGVGAGVTYNSEFGGACTLRVVSFTKYAHGAPLRVLVGGTYELGGEYLMSVTCTEMSADHASRQAWRVSYDEARDVLGVWPVWSHGVSTQAAC